MVRQRYSVEQSGGGGVTAEQRILILTRHYAPEPTGSAPPMQQLAEWLAENKGATQVVTSRPTYPENRVTPGYEHGQRDRCVEQGVSVRRWPARAVQGKGLLSRSVPEVRFMLQLLTARLTGSVPPSRSVISLCPSILTVVAALRYRKRGGRHVVIVHDIQSGLGAALGSRAVHLVLGLLRWIERAALNRVDHVVVLSDAMAESVRALGVKTPITVLPPQIDCNAIRPMDRPAGAPPTLMYSGNLGRKQGLDQLLDLAALLQVRAPEVMLRIRGEGAMRSQIAARIAAQSLHNVQLLPLVEPDKISASLAEGDVHLVPQIADGGDFAVPSKAFAIMAAGRPFLCTADDASSIGALARASGAFELVPPNDPETFATHALNLLKDGARRRELGDNGRRYAEQHVDTTVVSKHIARLLD
jgi:colanic acid biosynthesis glycosyl transferase WcaI